MSAVLSAFVQYYYNVYFAGSSRGRRHFLWKEVKNEEEHGKQHGWYWKYIR